MAIWKACFDESQGAGGKGWFVVAGVMAAMSQWSRLDRDWRKALKAYPAIPAFHMNQTGRTARHSPSSAFCGWSESATRRKIAALSRVLVTTSDLRLVTTFRLEDFWHVMNRTNLSDEYRDPYLLGFFQSFRLAAGYMSHLKGRHEKPILVFDKWTDRRREKRAREIYDLIADAPPDGNPEMRTLQRWLSRQVLFKDDVSEDIGLQAADLVAWHYHDAMNKAAKNQPWTSRRLMGRRVLQHRPLDRRSIGKWKDALRSHAARSRGNQWPPGPWG